MLLESLLRLAAERASAPELLLLRETRLLLLREALLLLRIALLGRKTLLLRSITRLLRKLLRWIALRLLGITLLEAHGRLLHLGPI